MDESRRDFFFNTGKSAFGLSIASLSGSIFTSCGSKLTSATKSISAVKSIPTLTGQISSDRLGTTLIHEHVLFGDIPEQNRKESIDLAVKMLTEAARVGIETIVDLSPTRDIELYRTIAEKVPLNIIVSTGAYIKDYMPSWLTQMNEEQFKDHMRKEITEGIAGTKIKAGIIKVAAAKTPLTEWETMVFRAGAEVQKELDVPMATHAIFEPRNQFDLLLKHGANPNRLFFSHIEAEFGWGGRSLKQMGDYLLALAKEGGHLLFNNFGYEWDTPWEDLVYLIRFLCDNELADKVLISVDCYWFWKNGKLWFGAEEKHPASRKRTYAYMMTDIVPSMLKAGFSAKELKTFLVDNPSRFFS